MVSTGEIIAAHEAKIEVLRISLAKDDLKHYSQYETEGGERILYESVPAAHHRYIIEKLEAIERGDIDRIMFFLPPGSAKSTYASVVFPTWYLGRNPTPKYYMCLSHPGPGRSLWTPCPKYCGLDIRFGGYSGLGLIQRQKPLVSGRWSARKGEESRDWRPVQGCGRGRCGSGLACGFTQH